MPSIFDSVLSEPTGRPATEAECAADPFFADCFPNPDAPNPEPLKAPEEYAADYLAAVREPSEIQKKYAHLIGFYNAEYGKRPVNDCVFDRISGTSVSLKEIGRDNSSGIRRYLN